jgi:hypothetical protein
MSTPVTEQTSAPPTPAESGHRSDAQQHDAHQQDPKAKDRASREAMARLTGPVKGTMWAARIMAALSAVLAIAPYVALVHLGGILLTAWSAGVAPDRDKVMLTVNVLIGTFCGRLMLYFVALALTHFADARLGASIRSDIVSSLARAPLAWFTSTNSGRVRKALQDDTHTIHMLVAHAPVETTCAVVMPIALFVYALIVDWRLGLLTIATFPIYAVLYAWSMRGMAVKTAGDGHQAGEGLGHHGGIRQRDHRGEGLRPGRPGPRELRHSGQGVHRLLPRLVRAAAQGLGPVHLRHLRPRCCCWSTSEGAPRWSAPAGSPRSTCWPAASSPWCCPPRSRSSAPASGPTRWPRLPPCGSPSCSTCRCCPSRTPTPRPLRVTTSASTM